MRNKRLVLAAVAAVLMLFGACSSASDSSSVAVGPGTPVPTTAPLAIPPVLRQPDAASADQTGPVATTAPIAAAPATASEAQTAPPTETPSSEATVEAAPTAVPPATAAPEPTTVTPTTGASAAAPAASASPQGAAISLGDFDVVNLVTGATQNIAELAPSGATMLWFWAPH